MRKVLVHMDYEVNATHFAGRLTCPDRLAVSMCVLPVLCLDGGGVRGLIELDTLAAISASAGGRPINELFDLIVGTSTGGMIALGVGCIGQESLPIERIKDTYRTMAQRIFGGDVQS